MSGRVTGLRRFARPAPASYGAPRAGGGSGAGGSDGPGGPGGSAGPGGAGGGAPSGPPGAVEMPDLPRIGGAAATADDGLEHCEMCATPLDDRHGHLVDLERRSLACACRACYLLFTAPGSGRGRYRAVPEDVHHDPAHPLGVTDWDTLGVPVGTAFFFLNSDLGRIVGCYPSPGGATETELDLAEWDRLSTECPLLGALSPDVQAIFVHRGEAGVDYFRVPIDACYALVGEVRMRWRGLDGGEEIRGTLAAFVDGLRERSRAWDETTDVAAPPWPV